MRTTLPIACLIIIGLNNSVKAQSSMLPLTARPNKSEITLISPPDKLTGALYQLKDTSILLSNTLTVTDYNEGTYELAELYIKDIDLIVSRRKMGPAGGAIFGALIGAGVFALGTRIAIGPPPYPTGWFGFSDDMNYLLTVPAGAISGALTGALIGGLGIKIPIHGNLENYNLQKKKLGRYTIKYPGSPTY